MRRGEDIGRRLGRSRAERSARDALHAARAPHEEAALARSRAEVLAAHASARRAPARRRPALALVATALALLAVAGALTAPGQAVGEWLRDVTRTSSPPDPARSPERGGLPAPGRLLATGPAGATLAGGDGAGGHRIIGAYRDAAWSPRGRFAAVTTRRELLAVTPAGAVRWRVTPPRPPQDPAWSPDGVRLAYLAHPELRVVVGDGTDDRLFWRRARRIPPVFRPTAGRSVAWVDSTGHVRLADVDQARLQWRSPAPVPANTRALAFTPDGERVLAAAPRVATLFSLEGGAPRAIAPRRGSRLAAVAYPPAGDGPPALLERRRGRSAIRLLGRRAPLIETSGAYDGLVWSPDGRWLVTRWGDRWLLVRSDGRSIATAEAHGTPRAWVR